MWSPRQWMPQGEGPALGRPAVTRPGIGDSGHGGQRASSSSESSRAYKAALITWGFCRPDRQTQRHSDTQQLTCTGPPGGRRINECVV